MPDLRESLDSFARTTTPDLWPDIQSRQPRPLPPRRLTGPIAVAALLLVLAAAVIVLPRVFLDRPSPANRATASAAPSEPTFHPQIAWRLKIGPNGQVPSLAYGAGSVWLASYEGRLAERDVVRRIDPATGQVMAAIDVPGVPPWEVGGGGMAFGDGDVWVVGRTDRDPTEGRTDAVVTRIEPDTNRVVAVIDLGGSDGVDVAIDDAGRVWAAVFGDGSRPAEVVRVDPSTDAVVGRFRLASDYVRRIAASTAGVIIEEYVWPGPSTLLERIDPETGIVETIDPAPLASHSNVVQWRDQIWLTSDSGLIRVDPTTGRAIGDPVRGGEVVNWLEAPGSDGIWFFVGRTLARFDPVTRSLQQVVDLANDILRPVSINVLAIGGEAAWILGYDGVLTRLDLQ
jgi:hypothetical protein